jgi:hypothetical protein
MAGSAAHLVDCVLPAVPVRQYVLAFPYELSGLAATRPGVLSALSRIFWEAVRVRYRKWAKGEGHAGGKVDTGAVTGVHRAGSSLNLHIHFHLLCLDGIYVKQGDTLAFMPAPVPSREELLTMVKSIHARVVRWLSRRGFLRDPDASNAAPEFSPAEALATTGMARGTLVTTREDSEAADEVDASKPAQLKDAAVYERFNVHASVHIRGDDFLGRERICRYLTRPAFWYRVLAFGAMVR